MSQNTPVPGVLGFESLRIESPMDFLIKVIEADTRQVEAAHEELQALTIETLVISEEAATRSAP